MDPLSGILLHALQNRAYLPFSVSHGKAIHLSLPPGPAQPQEPARNSDRTKKHASEARLPGVRTTEAGGRYHGCG